MATSKSSRIISAEAVDSSWKSLYTVGGVAALIATAVYVLDVIISFGETGVAPGTLSAVDWFALLQGKWMLGMRTLGFWNVLAMTVMAPAFFSLCAIHGQVNKAYATFAGVLYFVGVAVYISNNAAIPMLALSRQYAAATTDAGRSVFLAAAQALLARGEDFTLGALPGFLLTEIASIGISVVMLRGRIFNKVAALAGILGCTFLSIFTVLSTFAPALFNAVMVFGVGGGILELVWLVLIALRLFQLGQGERFMAAGTAHSKRVGPNR